MATGFPPKHTEDFPITDLAPSHFLILTLLTAVKLNWNIVHLGERGMIAYTNYGALKFNAEIKVLIENGVAELKSTSTGNEWIDFGKNKKVIQGFKDELRNIKAITPAEVLDQKYEELREALLPASQDTLLRPAEASLNIFTEFFAVFTPVKNYFVTPLLLNLNLLVFILMVFDGVSIMTPDSDSLIRWGANFTPLTLSGQWWRLLSSCFLHIGVLHLMMNMYALLFAGVLLDPILGRARFASAYLLSGIFASMSSLWWHQLTISAGASGAIFGMYGVVLALLTTHLIEKASRRALIISIGIFVVYNLANGMKAGIDNAAHIGGLISGFLIGLAFIPSLKKPLSQKLKWTTIASLFVIFMLALFFIYKNIPESKAKKFETTKGLSGNKVY